MGKYKDKYNAVEAFWQKILLEGEIFKIANNLRKKTGIPVFAFQTDKEWEEWRQDNIKKDGKWEKKRIKNVHNFIRAIKQKYPQYKGILSNLDFTKILTEFYHFGNILPETFQDRKYSGFDVFVIKNGNRFLFSSMGIDDGVYIKINPTASIDSIKKYIEANKPKIKGTQENFRLLEEIPTYKKLKIHKNFKRDNSIMYLNTFSKKELGKFGFIADYKEMQITDIMREKLGYKNITSEIVKAVIQRRRKMIKAEFEL